jgi:hypothetical protein
MWHYSHGMIIYLLFQKLYAIILLSFPYHVKTTFTKAYTDWLFNQITRNKALDSRKFLSEEIRNDFRYAILGPKIDNLNEWQL